MNTLKLKEPKNVFVSIIMSLIVITITVFYILFYSSRNSGILNFEYFKIISIVITCVMLLFNNINTFFNWLNSKKVIGSFDVILFKHRLTLFIVFGTTYLLIEKNEFDLKTDPLNPLIHIFTLIACTYIVGHLIWTKRFKSKFNENLSPNEDSKTPLALTSIEDFPIPTNNVTVIECLVSQEETDVKTNNIRENQQDVEVYQDVNLNIIQSNEDNLDASDFIPIETEDIHSETSVLPLNGNILNEHTESLLKLKVFSDEEIEELISKIIDKIHPSSIDDLKAFLKGGKPLNKMRWVSLGSRSRGIKYIDLFYFLHPIIDSEKTAFDGEERKALISLVSENFVTYHKEISKEIDWENANKRYTDYKNETLNSRKIVGYSK